MNPVGCGRAGGEIHCPFEQVNYRSALRPQPWLTARLYHSGLRSAVRRTGLSIAHKSATLDVSSGPREEVYKMAFIPMSKMPGPNVAPFFPTPTP